MANLSKTPYINFCQNRSSIVEVATQKFWCALYAHSVFCLFHLYAAKRRPRGSMHLRSLDELGCHLTETLVCPQVILVRCLDCTWEGEIMGS